MTVPVLALLVGVPLVFGVATSPLRRGPAHLLAALAMAAMSAGVVLAQPDAPLSLGATTLALSQIGRLELGFLATLGGLLVGYHYLAERESPLLPLLPIVLAAIAAGRVFSVHLLVAASFLLLASLLASLLMIGERPEWQAGVAGAAYLVQAALGGMALLFGFVLADLQRLSPGGLVTVPFVVAVLSVGFALLLGVAPLHFWLPNALLQAGAGAGALAAGVLGTATLGLLLQALTAQPQLIADDRVHWYFMAGGLLTAWAGAIAAVAPAKFRRVLGYVLVSDLGYVLVGMATFTRIGVAGAALHVAHRALVTLVLLVAAAELERDDRGATDGVAPAPYSWATLLLASLTLVGLPPLSGFAANWAIYQAAALVDWRLALALALSSLVCTVALLSALGRLRRDYPFPWRRPRPAETAVMALAVFAALWGLVPGPALGAIHGAVSQLPFVKPF